MSEEAPKNPHLQTVLKAIADMEKKVLDEIAGLRKEVDAIKAGLGEEFGEDLFS